MPWPAQAPPHWWSSAVRPGFRPHSQSRAATGSTSPGATRLALVLDGQSKPVATEKVRLGPGKYTVVAIGGKGGVDLLVYKDDGVQSGKATLRAIHAAAEVGDADVRLDGKVVVTGVGLGDATGYLPVPPGQPHRGRHPPRREGRRAREGERPSRARHCFLRLRRGQRRNARPGGAHAMTAAPGPQAAPATGLGGAATDGNWLLILGSSLIGGTIGGASYFLSRRVRTRGAMVVSPAAESDEPPKSFVAAGPPVAPKPRPRSEAEAPVAEPWQVPGRRHGRPTATGQRSRRTPPGTAGQPPLDASARRALAERSSPAPSCARTARASNPSPSAPRFIRPDADVAGAPQLPRFIIPDDEAKPPAPRFIRPEPVESRGRPRNRPRRRSSSPPVISPDGQPPSPLRRRRSRPDRRGPTPRAPRPLRSRP